MPQAERLYHLLIADDNAADLSLLEMGFRECPGVKLETHRLTHPRDLVSYLYGTPPYQGTVRPDLIVLDYHMATDGGASLSLIKGNPDVQQIPIIVVTGSDNPADVADIYYRHANACYRKGQELDDHFRLTCQIATHWLREVTLPIREDLTKIHPQRWKDAPTPPS